MRRLFLISILCLGLMNCAPSGSETPATSEPKSFDFDGVFDDTYAGDIDRTVISRRPEGPPNIVLIIADDLGWPYLGFLGDENVITPNMDILGNGGAVFELGHATSNHCRPTLQSLITGLHPVTYEQKIRDIGAQRLEEYKNIEERTPRERNLIRQQFETSAIELFDTLPRLLADKGYVSHQSGKWWEQSYAHGGFTHGMTGSWKWQDGADLGDKWFFTFMGGQGMEVGRKTMDPVTDFISDHADQPFFIWYGPALPHTPLNAPDKFYKYYEQREDLSESAKLYYANITWFDWGVGELIDQLREERVLDNTLIVYINDNGWEQPAGVEYADNHITFANGGPRGKGSFFETAFRTPIIFYWQGKIMPLRDRETLASAIDIMPTLLDYAGHSSYQGLPGYSLRDAIKGGELDNPRDFIIGRMTQHRAGTNFKGEPDSTTEDHMGKSLGGYYRRDHRWHFVWLPESDNIALWDIENDPEQLRDVSGSEPERIETFKRDIQVWINSFETQSE